MDGAGGRSRPVEIGLRRDWEQCSTLLLGWVLMLWIVPVSEDMAVGEGGEERERCVFDRGAGEEWGRASSQRHTSGRFFGQVTDETQNYKAKAPPPKPKLLILHIESV